MNRILLGIWAFMAVVCSANAQLYVKGDITKDGAVDVQDVTKLVNIINGIEAEETPEMLVAGKWYSKDGLVLTLNADGTTNDYGAETFKYFNNEGKITLYDAWGMVAMWIDVDIKNGAYMKAKFASSNETQVLFCEELYNLINGNGNDGPEEGASGDVKIALNITKTNWSKIGAVAGETVGIISSDATVIDHYSVSITCDDDPDQFISFADLYNASGEIKCYCPEAGAYDLFNGQHYTLHAYAFDVPYYGAEPVGEYVYKFVGTGKTPTLYKDGVSIAVGLQLNSKGLGYDINGDSFDITFSEPVSTVKAFWAMGLDGSMPFVATQKSADGTVWTITLTSDATTAEGSVNVNIVATDMNGLQLRNACDIRPFGFDVVVNSVFDY